MTVTERLTTGHPAFAQAARLLDEYRQHYGANPAPEAVAAWMRDLLVTHRMRVYVAGPGDRADGICTVAVTPATLTLRTAWMIRDLYVALPARRNGVAAALLECVAEEARLAGAHRLSLQSEAMNERAVHLYGRAGFEPVGDVALLHRIL